MRTLVSVAAVTTLALRRFARRAGALRPAQPRHRAAGAEAAGVRPLCAEQPAGPAARPDCGASGRAGPAPAKSPAELAREAAAYKLSDFVFDGSMEGDFDKAFPAFAEFAKGLAGAGVLARDAAPCT